MNKMFKMFLCGAVIGSTSLCPLAAQENGRQQTPPPPSTEEQWKERFEMDPGVIGVKLDEKGYIKSLTILGKGQVRRSMSKQTAKKQAGKECLRTAQVALAQYLNTKVEWSESASGELLIKEKGAAAGDDGAATSTEENVNTINNKEQINRYSHAALSAMRQVKVGVDADGMRAIAYGWSTKECQAVLKAAKIMGKTARASATEAKALEGAHLQDPNAAFQKASAKDEAAEKRAAGAASKGNSASGPGNNHTPLLKSAGSADADDFL